ncbi:hypothetical protein SESBI_23004 [Sesbania bispinosa]|nr:hypothetical protein SESBI_23004 [Sesbania bispinosa]
MPVKRPQDGGILMSTPITMFACTCAATSACTGATTSTLLDQALDPPVATPLLGALSSFVLLKLQDELSPLVEKMICILELCVLLSSRHT